MRSRTKRYVIGLVAVALLVGMAQEAFGEKGPHFYWPRFERPKWVYTINSVPTREDAILLETLAGLVARENRLHGLAEMIRYPIDHPSYDRWTAMMMERTGAKELGPYGIWGLVEHYAKRGIVKGYILYGYDDSNRKFGQETRDMDASVNVATSLCGPYGAVAISEDQEAKARELRLTKLFDVRGMTEQKGYWHSWDKFSKHVLALQDPKVNEVRTMAVALDAFVMSRPGPLYDEALRGLEPDSPILGWGMGDEKAMTKPSSQWGHFQTATNWCHNLPMYSTEVPGKTYPWTRIAKPYQRGLWDLSWEEDVHYAAFVMSDGDNVQWFMGDFVKDPHDCYWSNPHRGEFPIGWTSCYVDLAQLCPYTLEYLFQTATPRDDFILYGGGYYYPDAFGAKWPKRDVLEKHARRIGEYMNKGGVNLLALIAENWDSGYASLAYNTYARNIEDLLGMFAVQYAPYSAGAGEVKWAAGRRGAEVPVASARFSIWNNMNGERDDSPRAIAQRLNAMPHEGTPCTDDHFSWVVVHAWSWFKEPVEGLAIADEEVDQRQGGQPGTGRGLSPVKWCVDALDPHVKVVTPTDFMWLLRLHERPQQTLDAAFDGLKERLRALRKPWAASDNEAKAMLAEAKAELGLARRSLEAGDTAAAFEQGKAVDELLDQVELMAEKG